MVNNEHRINEEIKAKEVRLIGMDGNVIGIFALDAAQKMAWENNLDLIEISGNVTPIVCRIGDYGKMCYEQKKKMQESRKRQKVVQTKEMAFRPNIDVHDYDFKIRHVRKFLEKGDKVRVFMKFRGREVSHIELGEKVLNRVVDDLKDIAEVDQAPKMEGKSINLTLVPR